MKITPKDDKAVYSQSLPMPIHFKEDLIVELPLMHIHAQMIEKCHFGVRQVEFLGGTVSPAVIPQMAKNATAIPGIPDLLQNL